MPSLADCLKLYRSSTNPEFHLPDEVHDRLLRNEEIKYNRLIDSGMSEKDARRGAGEHAIGPYLKSVQDDLLSANKAIEGKKGPTPITDPAMHQAALDSAERIATQVTQGQGDIVQRAARDAAYDKIKKNMDAGKPTMSFVRETAMEAAGKAVKDQPTSLNAEKAEGQSVGDTVASEQPTPAQSAAKADMIDAVQKQVEALPAGIQKTAKAFLEAAQNGESTSLRDLGEKLGVSQQTVANHLKAMRDHFSGLKEEGYSVGPGAASISEQINNTIDPTSLKRAVVDVQREIEGRAGIDTPARPGSAELVSQAEDRVTADPTVGKKVVDRILDTNVHDQQVSPNDAATMLIERTRLRNERAAYEERAVDPHATQEERDSARYELSSIYNQIDRIDQASRVAGTAWSDFGRLYQQVIKDDYTLEALERKAIAAKGEGMTRAEFQEAYPEEHAKIVEQAKRIADLEEKAKANDAKVAEAERLKGIETAFNKFKSEAEKQTGFAPRVMALAKSIVDRLDKSADEARARIRDRLKNASAGIDPTVVYDVGVIGASKLAHATMDFATWSKDMISDLGEWVEPHLKEAWDHANKIWSDEEKRLGAKAPAVKKVRDKNADSATKQTNIVKAMQERIKSGDKITDLGRFVQSLGRKILEEGNVKDHTSWVDAVHEKLKQVDSSITRETTEDALSGYGNFRKLPTGDVDVLERDLKGQLQQVGKIRDLMAKKAPQKTGVERRVPSDEERRLANEVGDLKRKGGYEVTDPETQLKSSMDAIKTRLKNEIRDLDHAVATGERIKAKAGSPEYDAEAKALKAERDARKELYDRTFPKEPLSTAEQAARVSKALDKSIAGLEEDLKRGKIYDDPKAPRLTSPEIEAKRARLEALRDERDTLRQTDTARVEQAKEDALVKQINDKRNRILSGDTDAKVGKATVPTEKIAKLQTELDELNKQLAEARKGPAKSPEEIALQTFKTRATNRVAELKDRRARGDFSTRARTELKLDPEGQKIKADLAKEKLDFDRAREADRLKNRSRFEKILDGLQQWRRAFVLSGLRTLAKLTSAAAEIQAITPVENAIGGALGKIPGISKIAERAPTHGGFNPRAEAEAVKGTFQNLWKDFSSNLKTGHTDLDLLYGKPDIVPRHFLDFIGNVHGALKSSAKRNAFIRSFEQLVDTYSAKGIDVKDPAIQMQMGVEAYKQANAAVFREDHFVVTAYNNMLRGLVQKSKETGRPSLLGKAAEAGIKYTLPVVRIPTNIVARTFEYSFGHAVAATRIARSVFQEGLNNLSPHDADVIMRNLKRGTIGTAVMALGYFNADKIGGYYQPGQKRDDSDVKFGKIRVFGHDVPSYLIHNPLLEQLQIGATIRRVADSKLRKSDDETQGTGSGAMAAALGVIQEAPFLSDAELAVKLKDPGTRPSAVGELAKGVVPVLLQNVAEAQDKDVQGETVKRDPNTGKVLSTAVNTVKLGIPGLRKTVPEKEVHHPKASRRR